ncbi:hypothetical protein [Streptomyces sp. TS71-3]|uniref:hypothetical protein n=1 Tax=Streptomyces sp. TS71-3 TaxID=2733862 RepID=UPI001B17076B|nr:hypothetical protein [Streptomyces sp. TS71-3]GHJ35364.1 hypothetical protein Sm713_09730 [Streptomyces sp. TS71-3]
MVRDLYNVRELPAQDGPTPLTAEEEQRCRAAFLVEIGNAVADRGWARWPAYTTEERRRLYDIGRALSARWGRLVRVEAEDPTRMLFRLDDMPPAPESVTSGSVTSGSVMAGSLSSESLSPESLSPGRA